MTIDELKAAIPKLQELAEGRPVEARNHTGPNDDSHVWGYVYEELTDTIRMILNPDKYETRIKAEAKYRPWTVDEVPVGKVVRWKESGGRSAITAVSKGYILVELNWFPAEHYYDYFTMDDGSPCGVAVGE